MSLNFPEQTEHDSKTVFSGIE